MLGENISLESLYPSSYRGDTEIVCCNDNAVFKLGSKD